MGKCLHQRKHTVFTIISVYYCLHRNNCPQLYDCLYQYQSMTTLVQLTVDGIIYIAFTDIVPDSKVFKPVIVFLSYFYFYFLITVIYL